MSHSYYTCNTCGLEQYSRDHCFSHYLSAAHYSFQDWNTALDYDPTTDPQYEHQLSHFDPDAACQELTRPIDESLENEMDERRYWKMIERGNIPIYNEEGHSNENSI